MTEQEKLALSLKYDRELRRRTAQNNGSLRHGGERKTASICVIMNALVGRERKCVRE